jgi:hypothetical protein
MLLAKPNVSNNLNSKQFESFEECVAYLTEYTQPDVTIHMDEWIALGKILTVNSDGTTTTPEYYPKRKRNGEVTMVRFDIESFV